MKITPVAGRTSPTYMVECDPSYAANVPGIWPVKGKYSAPIDAAAVIAARAGLADGVPAPGDAYAGVSVAPAIAGLRDYQLAGVGRLVGNMQRGGGAILADDMGLGKTLQTLAVWNSLKRPTPLLVVCPASVRRSWLKEVNKWCPDTNVSLVENGKQAAAVTASAKVVVTSYELSKKLTITPHMVVMDEAHLLRGRRAERSNHLLELCKVASYRLALTGTPMWSRPRDFWMLLKILFGYRFGTANEFDAAYCGAYINQWGGKENKGATRLDELKQRLSYVMLRRTKEQVAAELPPLTRQVRWVPATKEAKLAVRAAALKQLPFVKALEATLDGKIEAAVEAAKAAGKSLLFTWQKDHAREMYKQLLADGLEVELLTGDDTPAERQLVIQRAVDRGASVVATLGSSAAGVDGLQYVADTAIFHALSYVPIEMAQAEARLHRIGQQNPVTVVYICMEDSADAYVQATVLDKLDAWRGSMGTDSTAAMGDTLSGGASKEQAEEAALAAIYEEMEE